MCGCRPCAPYWRPGLQLRHVPYTGNGTLRPIGSQARTQSTEPHQPGLKALILFYFIFKDFTYLLTYYVFIYFREREGREGEKHQHAVTSSAPPSGDLACNLKALILKHEETRTEAGMTKFY